MKQKQVSDDSKESFLFAFWITPIDTYVFAGNMSL